MTTMSNYKSLQELAALSSLADSDKMMVLLPADSGQGTEETVGSVDFPSFKQFMLAEANARITDLETRPGNGSFVTPVTMTLTGPVTGSVAFDGSANFTLATIIGPNAIGISSVTNLASTLQGLQDQLDADTSAYALGSTVFSAGNGLVGGGSLASSRSFTLATPSSITESSTNAVTATSHTHAFALADGALSIAKTAGLQGLLSNPKFIAQGGSKAIDYISAAGGSSYFYNSFSAVSWDLNTTNDDGSFRNQRIRVPRDYSVAVAIDGQTAWHAGNFNPAAKADAASPYLSGTVSFQSAGGSSSFGPGTGDGASYTTYNSLLKVWFGLGVSTFDGTINGFYDARAGRWDTKSAPRVNGADVWYPGNFNPAAKASSGTVGSADLNTAVTSGMYRMEAPSANGAPSGNYGQLLVLHGSGDTVAQVAFDFAGQHVSWRSGNPPDAGGSGTWSSWREFWHAGNFNPATLASVDTQPRFTGIQLKAANSASTLDIAANPSGGANDPDHFIYNRGNGAIWFGTNNALRGKMLADGTLQWNGQITIGGNTVWHTGSLNPQVGATGSSVVQRNPSGYIMNTYFNTTADVNPGVPSHIAMQVGSDNYIRWQTLAQFSTNLRATSSRTASPTTDWPVSSILRWKNYGAGHVIFDASNSTNPDGGACNNTTPDVAWGGGYPTLMGFNGTGTYGVRVYIANVADSTSGSGIVSGSRVFSGWDSGTPGSISCSQWFRTTGQTGIYFSDYGGGWYMTDATYVRTYQNKPVLASDFVISSDRRLKTGIRPLVYNGRLRPVAYTMIESGHNEVGFIAQEVQELYPEVVGVLPQTGYLQLSYNRVTAVLSAQVNLLEDDYTATKEVLVKQLANLRSQMAELKAMVLELKAA